MVSVVQLPFDTASCNQPSLSDACCIKRSWSGDASLLELSLPLVLAALHLMLTFRCAAVPRSWSSRSLCLTDLWDAQCPYVLQSMLVQQNVNILLQTTVASSWQRQRLHVAPETSCISDIVTLETRKRSGSVGAFVLLLSCQWSD